jgi:putative ABC transport system ATP-binding protein
MIRLYDVTKVYQMGLVQVRALDGVSLQIDPGEFVAITGPSGSGKSTMMHIIGCLDRPSTGRYEFNAQPVDHFSDRELAKLRNASIGFVFQTFNLLSSGSALQNVALPLFYAGRTRTAEPARRALEAVGLAHRAGHRPSELSGGERQRVAIARAIVNSPAIVLADEPTGNLDSKTGQQIMDIFQKLNAAGVTIILVSHEREIADQAHRIMQMRDGKIVSDRPTNGRRAVGPPTSSQAPPPHAPSAQPSAEPIHPKARSAWRAALVALVSLAATVMVPNAAAALALSSAARLLCSLLALGAAAVFVASTFFALGASRAARRELRASRGRLGGRGRAWAATAIGCLNLAIIVMVIASLIAWLTRGAPHP